MELEQSPILSSLLSRFLYLDVYYIVSRERSGSVVECLTQVRGVVGSSITGVTVLLLSKTHGPLLNTGSTPTLLKNSFLGRKESDQTTTTTLFPFPSLDISFLSLFLFMHLYFISLSILDFLSYLLSNVISKILNIKLDTHYESLLSSL